MGISKSICSLLVLVVLFASAANAQNIGGILVPTQLVCSALGNSTGGLVAPGTPLSLECGGIRLATAITGSNGESVLIYIGNVLNILNQLGSCAVKIPLSSPIGCRNLAPVGSLIGQLSLTNLTNTLPILPNVQVILQVLAVVGPFSVGS